VGPRHGGSILQHSPDKTCRNGYNCRKSVARVQALINIVFLGSACAGRAMSKPEAGYDYNRYKQLLAEAVDDAKRLELIKLMIREGARDKLEAQRTSDRVAMTAVTVAKILGPGGRRDHSRYD